MTGFVCASRSRPNTAAAYPPATTRGPRRGSNADDQCRQREQRPDAARNLEQRAGGEHQQRHRGVGGLTRPEPAHAGQDAHAEIHRQRQVRVSGERDVGVGERKRGHEPRSGQRPQCRELHRTQGAVHRECERDGEHPEGQVHQRVVPATEEICTREPASARPCPDSCGPASKYAVPPAANHASARSNGTMRPSSYQTRALVAHCVHESHGKSGCVATSVKSRAARNDEPRQQQAPERACAPFSERPERPADIFANELRSKLPMRRPTDRASCAARVGRPSRRAQVLRPGAAARSPVTSEIEFPQAKARAARAWQEKSRPGRRRRSTRQCHPVHPRAPRVRQRQQARNAECPDQEQPEQQSE